MQSNKIKKLFISIDGVPTMAKITEQRRRKELSSVINNAKGMIREKYGNTIDKDRIIYEQIKMSMGRKVFSGENNDTLERCVKYMSDKYGEFQYFLRKNINNCIEVIISGHDIPGEGEIKIFDDISKPKNASNHNIIVSPDSDAVLLSMMFAKNRTKILRQEDNTKNYLARGNIIDNSTFPEIMLIHTNVLCERIIKHVKNVLIGDNKRWIYNEGNIIRDITLVIFTLFGNDFLPKIETIDLVEHLDILIEAYLYVFTRQGGIKYLVYESFFNVSRFVSKDGYTKTFSINYKLFSDFINVVANMEPELTREKYLSLNYKNYESIRNIFNVKLLFPHLADYVIFANSVYDIFASDNNKKVIFNKINEAYRNARTNHCAKNSHIIKSLQKKKITEMINIFVAIEKIGNDHDRNSIIFEVDPTKKIKQFIEIFKFHDQTYHYAPQMKLLSKECNNVEYDPFHKRNIQSRLPDPNMKISDYDIQMYMLNNSIGDYSYLANHTKIGNVEIMRGYNKYKITISSSKDDSNTHYSFLGIDNAINPQNINKIDIVSKKYLIGIFWVFNYYSNSRESELTKKMVNDEWFYEHTHSPTLFYLSKYLQSITANDTIEINNIFKSTVVKYYPNDKKVVMTRDEQVMFTNPRRKLDGESLIDTDTHIKKIAETVLDPKKLEQSTQIDIRNRYLPRSTIVSDAERQSYSKLLEHVKSVNNNVNEENDII